MDFEKWDLEESPGVLCLSGPADRMIHQISSSIIDREKARHLGTQRLILYFFCSSSTPSGSILLHFIHTFLHQFTRGLLNAEEVSAIIKRFLHSLHQQAFKDDWETLGFDETDSVRQTIASLMKADPYKQWTALTAALVPSVQQGLIIVIDGLDDVGLDRSNFLREVCTFLERLEGSGFGLKALLASRAMSEIKEFLRRVRGIVFDDERKGTHAY
ncbi:hypothetical protein BJY01DRAFT_135033 [Aspergillus pseudoustus]|uniref:NACHT domain-containing protein n=1 Tax=Aspergillus pseudoustus TaxID=1810923 RepID=A0ABR4IJF6_9EURO